MPVLARLTTRKGAECQVFCPIQSVNPTLSTNVKWVRNNCSVKLYHGLCLSMFAYTGMYRGCSLWSAHGIGHPTGPGGGVHQKWVQCPNPAGTIGPTSRTLVHTRAKSVFCSQLYIEQLRVFCIHIEEVQGHTRPDMSEHVWQRKEQARK